MICWLGSSIAISQFGLISLGTFHYLSWDIMEPICYLMTFSNFTFGFGFYLAAKKDLDLTNFFDILTYRFVKSASKRRGICLEEHEERKEEIRRLEEHLKHITNL